MTRLLVLRPQPGADATVRRAKALGLDAIAAPLFVVRALAWEAPDPAGFDALLLTSANAMRLGGPALARYHGLPVYAVGRASTEAAEDAGFSTVTVGDADGAHILARAVAEGKTRLLHLTGRDHLALVHADAAIERRLVYASDAVPALPGAITEGSIALLHSARAATLFGTLVDAARLDRRRIALACLSEAIREAAGACWSAALAARTPDDQALLAIAARLCDQDAGREDRA